MPQKPTVPRVAGSAVELLSVELLEEHARRLAALISTAPHGSSNGRVHIRQLKAHMRALRQVYTQLAGDTESEAVSPAAEWLLDNFHIIAAAARLFGGAAPPRSQPTTTTSTAVRPAAPVTATAAPAAPGSPQLTSMAEDAQGHYQRAIEAQRAGDWAKYGEEIRALGQTLDRMKQR